jgi:hypothetical protein
MLPVSSLQKWKYRNDQKCQQKISIEYEKIHFQQKSKHLFDIQIKIVIDAFR